jgi:hypothetical protein
MLIAYVDPGAGSLLIQAILAGILSVPFVFRTKLAALVTRVRRGSPNRGTDTQRPLD